MLIPRYTEITSICEYCHHKFTYKKYAVFRKYCCHSHKDMAYQKGLRGKIAKQRANLKWLYSEKGIEYQKKYNKTIGRILRQREQRWKTRWGKNGIKAWERDNYKCVICGFSIKECLQINHIIPKSIEINNNVDNLEILCANCHHFITIYQRYALAGKKEERKTMDWNLIHFDSVKMLRDRLDGS